MMDTVPGDPGYIDDVRIYSTARTQVEIAASMWGLDPSTPGLEGWWQVSSDALPFSELIRVDISLLDSELCRRGWCVVQ
eukprot:609713-Rhodomonas_salina.3